MLPFAEFSANEGPRKFSVVATRFHAGSNLAEGREQIEISASFRGGFA
jgi:hypothetical protein